MFNSALRDLDLDLVLDSVSTLMLGWIMDFIYYSDLDFCILLSPQSVNPNPTTTIDQLYSMQEIINRHHMYSNAVDRFIMFSPRISLSLICSRMLLF